MFTVTIKGILEKEVAEGIANYIRTDDLPDSIKVEVYEDVDVIFPSTEYAENDPNASWSLPK